MACFDCEGTPLIILGASSKSLSAPRQKLGLDSSISNLNFVIMIRASYGLHPRHIGSQAWHSEYSNLQISPQTHAGFSEDDVLKNDKTLQNRSFTAGRMSLFKKIGEKENSENLYTGTTLHMIGFRAT